MAIESKNLLVYVKALSRGQALPLDASEVWETKAEAEAYAAGIANTSTVAYIGQTLKVKENGTVTSYVIKDNNGTLIRLADADAVDAAIAAIPEPEVITEAEIIALVNEVFPEEV